jgi:hypothetical protein
MDGYLVIQQEASAGIIIAGAILTSRALAPVELAIAHWKGMVAARQSWKRLQQHWRVQTDRGPRGKNSIARDVSGEGVRGCGRSHVLWRLEATIASISPTP